MHLVSEIMTKSPVTVAEDTTLEQIARTMLDRRIGAVLVVDSGGKLVGIVTESDFAAKSRCVPFSTFRAPEIFGRWLTPQHIEQMYADARTIQAREIMTKDVETVEDTAPIHSAVRHMLRRDVNRIPVVRDGIPVGIVARHDLLKMMLDGMDAE